MNVTKHELIQAYLQEIHEQLGFSSQNSNLWAQIQEDILEHVQDAYDNWNSEDTQNVSLIINSILHELGPPPTIARAYLASNPDPAPETNKGRFKRRVKKFNKVPRYIFAGLTFPFRKTIKLIIVHKKIMIPYLLILITLYSALFAAQPIYHDKNATPVLLIDSLGRPAEENYWEFIDIEIVNDRLLILDEDFPESHLYFYEITEYNDPIHRATIDLGWEASSMKIFDNLVYVLSRSLNYNSNGSMYKVNVYDITDVADVTLVGNYSSPQIPNLGYDAEIVFVNSSQLIHFDSKNLYFHALANRTEISPLTHHNITREGHTYPESITHAEIYNDLIFLSADDDFYTFQYVNNSEFVQLHTVDFDFTIENFQIDNDIAYIVSRYHEIVSLTISNIFKPQIIEIFQTDHSTAYRGNVHIDISDGNLFFANEYSKGVSQIDITTAGSMKLIGKYEQYYGIHDLEQYEDVLYVANTGEGLQIWNLEVFSGGLLFLKLTAILNWTALISVISLGVSFGIFYVRKRTRKKGR